MATVAGTGQWIKRGVHKTTWLSLTTANADGSAQSLPDLSDKSFQVEGNFGTGGNIQIQGSNDGGLTWNVLNDPQGTPLDFATPSKILQTLENPELIRPFLSAGDGVTDLNVHMVAHGQN